MNFSSFKFQQIRLSVHKKKSKEKRKFDIAVDSTFDKEILLCLFLNELIRLIRVSLIRDDRLIRRIQIERKKNGIFPDMNRE